MRKQSLRQNMCLSSTLQCKHPSPGIVRPLAHLDHADGVELELAQLVARLDHLQDRQEAIHGQEANNIGSDCSDKSKQCTRNSHSSKSKQCSSKARSYLRSQDTPHKPLQYDARCSMSRYLFDAGRVAAHGAPGLEHPQHVLQRQPGLGQVQEHRVSPRVGHVGEAAGLGAVLLRGGCAAAAAARTAACAIAIVVTSVTTSSSFGRWRRSSDYAATDVAVSDSDEVTHTQPY